MASQGPNSPSTATASNWSSPNNITSSNNAHASKQFNSGGGTSDTLQATSFGFSIPSGATIDGIVVEIERYADSNFPTLNITDNEIRLIKGGVISGTNKATATSWSTTESYFTYGGSSDLWGLSLTRTDVNASNFGVSIKVTGTVLEKAQVSAFVDHVRITVHYTESGGGGSQTNALLMAGD